MQHLEDMMYLTSAKDAQKMQNGRLIVSSSVKVHVLISR